MKIKIALLFVFIYASCFAQPKFESEFERVTDSLLASNPLIPGMIVSYVCGDYKWEKAKGYADFDKKIPMTLDKTYRIGSVTKTFTVTVLLELVDEGKLSLDDKLSKFFPEIRNSDSITVRMLADMRSGIYNYSEPPQFEDSLANRPKKSWTSRQLVDLGLSYPNYFSPNSDFHYSNTNTVIISQIIDKITGNTWQDEIRKRIFEPLGLKNSTTGIGTEMIGDYAHGYMLMDSSTTKLTDVTTYYNVSWAGAAGDIISNIHDIKIYLKALGTGKFYSEKIKNERADWKFSSGYLKYGLGLYTIGHGFVGHNGGIPGFANTSVYSPEHDCSLIVMFNNMGNNISTDILALRLLELAGYK
jgi:D-alanyl-D-alanine carboxypeptidase